MTGANPYSPVSLTPSVGKTRFGICSAGYFQTLGLPLLRGRFFSEDDVNAQRCLMVVSQTFVRQYFPAEDPLGQKVKLQVLDRPFLDANSKTPHLKRLRHLWVGIRNAAGILSSNVARIALFALASCTR